MAQEHEGPRLSVRECACGNRARTGRKECHACATYRSRNGCARPPAVYTAHGRRLQAGPKGRPVAGFTDLTLPEDMGACTITREAYLRANGQCVGCAVPLEQPAELCATCEQQ